MVNIKDSLLEPKVGNMPNPEAWLTHITQDRLLADQKAIRESYELACLIHQDRVRASGELHIIHDLTVADILADLGMETDVIVAGILHEVTENNGTRIEEIQKRFGTSVANLVNGVCKMRFIDELDDSIKRSTEEDNRSEGLRKMLLAMVNDVRVVLIKLADRLHNMRTLRFLPEHRQRKFAQETLDLFAPLANRLGIWQIKWQLEDLSLRYLEPEIYQTLAKSLDEKRVDRENYIRQVVEILQNEVKQAHVKAEVSGRPKHIYSIWRKMQRKGLDFDQIFDVRGIRVLVDTIPECYLVLGIVHNRWQPIHNEFDDYIANPKSNDYRSLHTAVIGPEQKIFEVQIRTHDMHHHAELGVASHWRYKEGAEFDQSFERKIAWLRQILQWKEEESSPSEFIDRFKAEIVEDRVYVLSPQGKVVDLPQGATPLDFAYYIHTQLGHCCRGAKVNNRIVPLTYILKTGEQVEILTSKEERPSRDWLNFHSGYLKTSRARSKVRQWLRKQNVQQHISDGRTLLERELRRLNIHDLSLEQLSQRLRFNNLEDFLTALGRGDISINQVTHIISEQIFPKKPIVISVVAETPSPSLEGIWIKGVSGLMTQRARCCNAEPLDPVIGYITKGRGVIIHRRDCPNAQRWQDEGNERLIEVDWNQPVEQNTLYPVTIQVRAFDRTGLLRDVGAIAANEKVNIIATSTITNKADNTVNMELTLEIQDLSELSRVLTKIDNLSNVLEVCRKS